MNSAIKNWHEMCQDMTANEHDSMTHYRKKLLKYEIKLKYAIMKCADLVCQL